MVFSASLAQSLYTETYSTFSLLSHIWVELMNSPPVFHVPGPVLLLDALLRIQFPANALGKSVEDGPKV